MSNASQDYSVIKSASESALNMPPNFVHPLYIELQKRSPMSHWNTNDTLDYKVNECDGTECDDARVFYIEYISRSLPLVFRKYALDWDITKEIIRAVEQDKAESPTGDGKAKTKNNIDACL